MKAPGRRILAGNIAFGLLFGFAIANIGFGDFGELNRMFTFGDLRMLGAFGGGVALAAAAFAVVGRPPPRARLHAGLVPGAMLFGTGWAISGGCPAIPIVQVASGAVPGVATIAGVVVGMAACRRANERWFHLDRGSCGL